MCGSTSLIQNECPLKEKNMLVADGTRENSDPPDDEVEHEHSLGLALNTLTTPPYGGWEEA